MEYTMIYLLCINITAFLMYGLDKWKAQKDKHRISEKTLLTLAVAGGSVGAYAGMRVFHHKTRKPKFSVGVPVIMILQAAVLIYLFQT